MSAGDATTPHYRVNTLLAGVAEPAIAEAQGWIAGRTFPKDKPLIDVCQAVPGYPPPAALTDHLARIVSEPATSRYTDIWRRPKLRAALAEGRLLRAIECHNPLSAMLGSMAEGSHGQQFDALWASGFAQATAMGLPDAELSLLERRLDTLGDIASVTSLPLIVDADTGFGNALNVRHTIRTLERAGADCVQLEDQVSPKRCGHFSGKAVIDSAEMVGKIKAAADARVDSGLLIMARTDARAVHGFEAAVERAQAFAEAGADILFVEAAESADEIRALPERLAAPQLMNMVIGGRTPIFDADALAGLGYAIVLYANAALQGALAGMQRALTALRDTHRLDEDPALVAPFAERQRLVGKPLIDALERKYAGS